MERNEQLLCYIFLYFYKNFFLKKNVYFGTNIYQQNENLYLYGQVKIISKLLFRDYLQQKK